MTIGQSVAGAAALTSSATAFTASVPGAGATFVVASAAGYPSSGAFTVQLNRGLADEEKIKVSSRSGTTFTVETRGYDGTTAQSHTNPTVNLILPATVVNALIDHVDGNELAPHATTLPVGTTTGHDTTTRHVFGAGNTALGPGTTVPTTITPDDSGSAGSASGAARADHRHAITTDVAVSVGTVNSEGAASTFARSNHVHALATTSFAASLFAAPTTIAPDDTASAGSADTISRSDHRHGFTAATAAALTRTATASEGVAVNHARSDHVHATDQMAWGKIAKQTLTSSGSALGSPASSDFTLTLTVDSTRLYRVYLHTAVTYSAQSEWDINFVNLTDLATLQLDRVDVLTGADRQWTSVALPWEPTSGSKTVEVQVSRNSGSGTLTFSAGANLPRSFWIEDAGPR